MMIMTVAITQKKNGAHNATITLNGTYGTNLSLSQTGIQLKIIHSHKIV